MKTIREFLKETSGEMEPRPSIVCADGYLVSVQAGHGAHSIPREAADSDEYSHVEIKVSTRDRDLDEYYDGDADSIDEKDRYLAYGNVPISVVEGVISKHGGIAGTCKPGGAC